MPWTWHEPALSQFLSVPKNQNHVRFMSLSWQFHGTFTYKPYLGTVCQNLLEKLSKKSVLVVDFFLPNFGFIFGNMSDSCHFHGSFMAVSWHFHMQVLPGYSLPKSIGKVIQKVGVGCRFSFFCLISASFSAICQIHVGFMALSWHFLPSDFYFFSCKKSKPTTESISKMTV